MHYVVVHVEDHIRRPMRCGTVLGIRAPMDQKFPPELSWDRDGRNPLLLQRVWVHRAADNGQAGAGSKVFFSF